jgi:two-component system chemotaxis response regulator CheY
MKTIMAVDDSATVRQALNMTLTGAGYEIIEAVDGDDALSQLEGREIDLLITDLHMPNLNGIELIKRVRSHPDTRFLPIIMLTSESQEEKRQEGKEAGVSGWIVKPFRPDQLLSVIRMVCPT